MNNSGLIPLFFRRATCALVTLGLAIAQPGCGGGGGDGVVGSGGTGASVPTVSVGPIAGFGSIIVNGVKYDDGSASLSRDDRSALARTDLRLGMFVEVRGVANSNTGLGTATSVVVTSELKGVVESVSANDFQLLGVTVQSNANTVLDNAGSIAVGDFVEVYGVFDAVNRSLLATRIEKKTIVESKVRGIVSGLDTSARRFSIGNVQVDYRNIATVPGLANGAQVSVSGSAPPASGPWLVSSVNVLSTVSVSESYRVELTAVIGQFSSLANFWVAGLQADGSSAVIEGGTASALANGVRVEIEGTVQAGILRASKIEIKSSGSGGSGGSSSGGSSSGGSSSGGSSSGGSSSGGSSSGGSSSGGSSSGGSSSGSSGSGSTSGGDGSSSSEFEVKGTISNFASASSFIVRGTRISATGAVSYDGGSAGSLANGACVEIKGTLTTTASGSILSATRIKFEDGC